jgi:hypothetical protein
MIVVGIDDTDVAGSRGTNQLARRIVDALSADWRCLRIVRHQLLDDPRVPCTTKNGAASIALERRSGTSNASDTHFVLDCCRRVMRSDFIEGSDPGLCVLAGDCPPEVIHWGRRCQHELVARDEAFAIAARTGLPLEVLGGSEDGVIGALAAVGLASTGDDGRIVQLGEWPDDLAGPQTVGVLEERGVQVREYESTANVTSGTVDVGKRLRPNMRQGRAVLFVESDDVQPGVYSALKLP